MTSTDLPAGTGYGLVVVRNLTNEADTADADRYPDGAAVIGMYRLTPSIKKLVDQSASPSPVGIWLKSLTFNANPSGELVGPDIEIGGWVIATDSPNYNYRDWTYKVEEILTASGLAGDTYYIHVPQDSVTDLNTCPRVPQSVGVDVLPPTQFLLTSQTLLTSTSLLTAGG